MRSLVSYLWIFPISVSTRVLSQTECSTIRTASSIPSPAPEHPQVYSHAHITASHSPTSKEVLLGRILTESYLLSILSRKLLICTPIHRNINKFFPHSANNFHVTRLRLLSDDESWKWFGLEGTLSKSATHCWTKGAVRKGQKAWTLKMSTLRILSKI